MKIDFVRLQIYLRGNLYFTLVTGAVTGISNSIASGIQTSADTIDLVIDFFHAGSGSIAFGLIVNFVPVIFNEKFSKRSYFWLTGNLMMLGINILAVSFQYLVQTENPFESRLVPTIASQSLENIIILRNQRKSRA